MVVRPTTASVPHTTNTENTTGRPIVVVLSRLEGVRQTTHGWLARCPVPTHGKGRGDKNPSLAVTETPDGKVLLHCYAKCPTSEILRYAGLHWQDLFPDGVGPRPRMSDHSRRHGLSMRNMVQRYREERKRVRHVLAAMIRETEAELRRAGPRVLESARLAAMGWRLPWWEYLLDLLLDDPANVWALAAAAKEVRQWI